MTTFSEETVQKNESGAAPQAIDATTDAPPALTEPGEVKKAESVKTAIDKMSKRTRAAGKRPAKKSAPAKKKAAKKPAKRARKATPKKAKPAKKRAAKKAQGRPAKPKGEKFIIKGISLHPKVWGKLDKICKRDRVSRGALVTKLVERAK